MAQCKGLKSDRTQCKRTPAPGSIYCWQHKKIYEKIPQIKIKRANSPGAYSKRITRKENAPTQEDYNIALQKLNENNWTINSFDVVKQLGKGSFGTVFSAKDKSTGKMWVIKRVSKEGTSKSLIMKEINVLKHLKPFCEPYILCYEHYFEDKHNYYVITQYLGGLVPLIDLVGKMKKPQIIGVITNLIKGLMEIHKHNVAHRDIKPENIMVSEKGDQIKYIDFGSACYDYECEKRTIEGTPIFMPPELIKDHILGHDVPRTFQQYQKADIWSLGLTIWELITGENRLDHWEIWLMNRLKEDDIDNFEKLTQLNETDPSKYLLEILKLYSDNFEYFKSGDWKIDTNVEKFLAPYKLTLKPMLQNDPNKRTFPLLY